MRRFLRWLSYIGKPQVEPWATFRKVSNCEYINQNGANRE